MATIVAALFVIMVHYLPCYNGGYNGVRYRDFMGKMQQQKRIDKDETKSCLLNLNAPIPACVTDALKQVLY